jgi:hypothetical protein
MKAMVTHFCDKTMFFPWVPFIQMHLVINIFVIYQLGLGFKLKNSLWRELCGYLLIKKPFVNNYELLKLKNMDWLFGWTITNGKIYIDSHFKFVIGIKYTL